jgi:hypothetical protein
MREVAGGSLGTRMLCDFGCGACRCRHSVRRFIWRQFRANERCGGDIESPRSVPGCPNAHGTTDSYRQVNADSLTAAICVADRYPHP